MKLPEKVARALCEKAGYTIGQIPPCVHCAVEGDVLTCGLWPQFEDEALAAIHIIRKHDRGK